MALLTYAIDNSELTTIGSLALLQTNIPSMTVIKMLYIALDPMIDPSVVRPALAYQNYSV